jgi:hypothetical protein
VEKWTETFEIHQGTMEQKQSRTALYACKGNYIYSRIWSIPAPYDYTHMHFPTHLFLYMFSIIPEGAMNASACPS